MFRESEVTKGILVNLEMKVILEMMVTLVLQDLLENLVPKVQLGRKAFLDSMGKLGPGEFLGLVDQGEIQGSLEQM